MKRLLLSTTFLLAALVPVLSLAAVLPSASMKSAVVLIASYDGENTFKGWGSGFFVDEGIVVTNKHVLVEGAWYRVYATGSDDFVNFDCFTTIQKSDVRFNPNDDVAYIRAHVPCQYGTLDLANDPMHGDEIAVLGYPSKGLTSTSVRMSISTGSVVGDANGDWRQTDARLDTGNSGGPVVSETEVVGVAVAKATDSHGNYLIGYFIPSSVILEGLLLANRAGFDYVPRSMSSHSSSISSSSSSSSNSRSRSSSVSSRSRSSVSSPRSSAGRVFRDVRPSRAGYAAIMSLHEQGILEGYPNGTFRPDGSINRAEFIKILVAGFRDNETKGESRCFRDVGTEWFATYVCAAKRLGWIEGYPDETFRPSQFINRAEAMKILVSAFGADTASRMPLPSDVPLDAWFAPSVAAGVRIGIVSPLSPFSPAENLTRENGAMWIDGAM
jgi:hypothetical protein